MCLKWSSVKMADVQKLTIYQRQKNSKIFTLNFASTIFLHYEIFAIGIATLKNDLKTMISHLRTKKFTTKLRIRS